jgi:hypothetical protein
LPPAPVLLCSYTSFFYLWLTLLPSCVLADMNPEKLAKMAAQVRTGGKGSVRRKKKAVHKTTTTDDKRLQNTLKRLGVNNIPAIEEVNLFKDNGTVIHFNNPKVRGWRLPFAIALIVPHARAPAY